MCVCSLCKIWSITLLRFSLEAARRRMLLRFRRSSPLRSVNMDANFSLMLSWGAWFCNAFILLELILNSILRRLQIFPSYTNLRQTCESFARHWIPPLVRSEVCVEKWLPILDFDIARQNVRVSDVVDFVLEQKLDDLEFLPFGCMSQDGLRRGTHAICKPLFEQDLSLFYNCLKVIGFRVSDQNSYKSNETIIWRFCPCRWSKSSKSAVAKIRL